MHTFSGLPLGYPLMYYLHSLAQCYSHLSLLYVAARMDHDRSQTRLARMLTTAQMDHNRSRTSSRNKARARAKALINTSIYTLALALALFLDEVQLRS